MTLNFAEWFFFYNYKSSACFCKINAIILERTGSPLLRLWIQVDKCGFHLGEYIQLHYSGCFLLGVKIFRWMDGYLINFCRKSSPCATVVRLVSTVHNNSDSFLMLVWLHQSCTLIFNFVHGFYRQNFYSQQGQCIGFIIRFSDFRISLVFADIVVYRIKTSTSHSSTLYPSMK